MDGEAPMITYSVTVARDGNLWTAVVNGLAPHVIGATDAERFADLEDEVPELIAALTDSDPGSFGLEWHLELDGRDLTEAVKTLRHAESALEAAVRAREDARGVLLRDLAEAGLSQAAIGDVLGISHQRVHQLLKAS